MDRKAEAGIYFSNGDRAMTTQTALEAWIQSNRRTLEMEFSRIKAGLRREPEKDSGQMFFSPRTEMQPPPAIDYLTELFGLSRFERELLLLCAGVEMDSEIAALCADAQSNSGRPMVTFGLALASLTDSHWSAFTPTRPLRRFRLVSLEEGYGLISAPIRIDERILHYLAGTNTIDSRLEATRHPSGSPLWISIEHEAVAEEIRRVLSADAGGSLVLHLCGDDPQGQEDVATLAIHGAGRQLFIARGEDLPAPGPDLDLFEILWQREALLLRGALMVQCGCSGVNASARQLAEKLPGNVVLGSWEPVSLSRRFLRFDVDKPKPAEQKRLWQRALSESTIPPKTVLDETLNNLAEQFCLSAKTIYETGTLTAIPESPVQTADLWSVCRAMSRPRLEGLAQRIVPKADWDDLVLPDMQTEVLRQIVSHMQHRLQVYETWGFRAKGHRGLGVSALFAGESGVGKTLAAEVLARHLSLDLYRVDVAAVVSKYIGETSKNMRQVFDAAEEGGVLLLFDEADAMFGKRSEVKDSHDRYANIDISYLLQRMETFLGLSILTTNLRGSLDRAFQRRLRFIVNFPFPNAQQRETIWSRIFPPQTPTEEVDARKLAQLNVAGGSIRNIALNAAFMAASEDTAVKMTHLLSAARLEAQKMDRALSEAEIRGWV